MKKKPSVNPVSRRRFCASVALAPLWAAPALAACRVQRNPPSNADLPAEMLYAIGVRMLREGRTYEKAAANFALAAQKEPENPAHLFSLGCAYASRAASVAYAARFNQEWTAYRADFSDVLSKWENGREAFERSKKQFPLVYGAARFEDTKPTVPSVRVFVTKDDKTPLRLTPAETGVYLSRLSRQAQEAWKKALIFVPNARRKSNGFICGGMGFVRPATLPPRFQ